MCDGHTPAGRDNSRHVIFKNKMTTPESIHKQNILSEMRRISETKNVSYLEDQNILYRTEEKNNNRIQSHAT